MDILLGGLNTLSTPIMSELWTSILIVFVPLALPLVMGVGSVWVGIKELHGAAIHLQEATRLIPHTLVGLRTKIMMEVGRKLN